jgi:hypothetical protein
MILTRKDRVPPVGVAPSNFVGLAVLMPHQYFTTSPFDYVDMTVDTQEWEVYLYSTPTSVAKLRAIENRQMHDCFIGYAGSYNKQERSASLERPLNLGDFPWA